VRRFPQLLALVLAAALGAALIIELDHQQGPHDEISASARGPYRGSTHPFVIRLPSFTLRNQDGKLVSSHALIGRVIVLTFLDTDCKESCPVIAGVIGATIPRLTADERKQVTSLAVSVNPASDTPGTVHQFLRKRHALGKLDFLLGSVRTLEPVWHAFQILSAHKSGNADIHSAPVRIYDRNGVWVSTLSAGADLTIANLVHDIRQALSG
jgi:cytochrome oxidase Cu insertion factor (SCO1/SenC/PrrC family)